MKLSHRTVMAAGNGAHRCGSSRAFLDRSLMLLRARPVSCEREGKIFLGGIQIFNPEPVVGLTLRAGGCVHRSHVSSVLAALPRVRALGLRASLLQRSLPLGRAFRPSSLCEWFSPQI